MANVATMGPPPSPKEPRRSGRRPAPSSSKSPAGSPPSEANPAASKPKDASGRPSLNSSHNNGSGRNKRAKNEEFDEPLEEPHPAKNGVTTNGGSARSISYSGVPNQILFYESGGAHDACTNGNQASASGSGCSTAPAG